ncbi:MAG TPA: putative molybdenum carrier protein [Pyrinomonadaceae bacterium]
MPNKLFSVAKIVSGGQTGVDRAALDFALANGISIGGYVPKGRLAEGGPIDTKYGPLTETKTIDPAERTVLNVLDSDGTLIIHRGEISGGTELTRDIALVRNKPHLTIDLNDESEANIRTAGAWLEDTAPATLNVAGPRESESPGIYQETLVFLGTILKK